jgi:hypothetical protein
VESAEEYWLILTFHHRPYRPPFMLYIPRRHRRKLLLPPGLLALAFLLLVGCGVIAPIAKERTKAFLRITMPELRPTTDEYERISVQNLASMRQWESFEITGSKLFDCFNWQQAKQRIKALQQTPDTIHGVKIHFGQNAKYLYIIKSLSYLIEVDAKSYVLDIRIPVTTLYVLGKRPPNPNQYICSYQGGSLRTISYPPPSPTFKQELEKLMQKNGLQITDFSSWFIAGLAIVIMTVRKLAVSTLS